jgi:hypothetical protein
MGIFFAKQSPESRVPEPECVHGDMPGCVDGAFTIKKSDKLDITTPGRIIKIDGHRAHDLYLSLEEDGTLQIQATKMMKVMDDDNRMCINVHNMTISGWRSIRATQDGQGIKIKKIHLSTDA